MPKTEDLVENPGFRGVVSFLKAAIFSRNKISEKEKKHAPRLRQRTFKKIFSLIGPTVLEKKGENFFFSVRKPISRKLQNNENLCFCIFSFFLFILNDYKFCLVVH